MWAENVKLFSRRITPETSIYIIIEFFFCVGCQKEAIIPRGDFEFHNKKSPLGFVKWPHQAGSLLKGASYTKPTQGAISRRLKASAYLRKTLFTSPVWPKPPMLTRRDNHIFIFWGTQTVEPFCIHQGRKVTITVQSSSLGIGMA